MNRRSVIRTIVFTSAGAAFLPSCLSGDAPRVAGFDKIRISAGQAKMLSALTQAIIPSTDTPGAREEKTDEFILRMVNDCGSPEEQAKFSSGIEEFEKLVSDRFDRSFTALSDAQRKELLRELEHETNSPGDAAGFYKTVRGFAIQHYTGAEYYMTRVMDYNIIPKRYRGCVPVAAG
jgi:hypothetical protein